MKERIDATDGMFRFLADKIEREDAHECDFPDTCPVCLGPKPKPAVTVESRFTARYPGHCRECNFPIYTGQRVAKLSTGTYAHDGCEVTK